MSDGEIPEDGIASLPEVTDGGLSQADAVAVIEAWLAAHGAIEFFIFIENSDPMALLAQLIAVNWYDAGVVAEVYVDDDDAHAANFSMGRLDDIAVAHRPGLLP